MTPPGSPPRFVSRLTRSPSVVAASGYVLLTVALTYPLSLHPASTTFPPSSDLNLYIWTLAWNAHAFLHHPLAIFDANIFYPYQRTLAYSENLIGVAVLVAPVQWLLREPLLAMNLAAMATVPLCALGAFLLARRLQMGVQAAWVCGLVYGFAPPRFLRLDQAHLTAVEWIPFCLAYAHSYASSGRKRDLRVALAFLSAQVLTSGHGAVFLLFALGIWLAFRLATGAPVSVLTTIRDAGLPGALFLVPVVALLVPYRLVQVQVGLRRELTDWTGSWASFLASPTHVDAFITGHLGSFGSWIASDAQAYLFPGVLPVVLATAAFLAGRVPATAYRLRTPARIWFARLLETACIGLLALILYSIASATPRIEIAGITLSLRNPWRAWMIVALVAAARIALRGRVPFALKTRWTNLTRWREQVRGDMRVCYLVLVVACLLLAIGPPNGPWRFLYWLPGLSFIRVPSRFMILAMLGVGVLCGFGFERLTAVASRRTRWMSVAGVSIALVAEFAVIPFEVVPNPVVIPAADRWLNDRPKPFVVAELPPMDPSIPMLHSMAHWQKTVHGYSGWTPAITVEIAAQLARFPDDESIDALTRVGVTYVVIHSSMYAPGEWLAMAARLDRFAARLKLEYADAEGRVYTFEAPRGTGGQVPASPTSTRTWQPSSRVSVEPRSTSAGRNPTGA